METSLVMQECWGCLQAASLLGKEQVVRGKRVVPVAFAPHRLPCSLYLIIPKGFVGLVNKHGRYVGVYKAGLHCAAPWVSISHLIPQQYTVYDTPVKECPTQDNVMVTIDVALIFRVMVEDEQSLYKFAYRLGPDKLDKMLKAFQEEAMRGMVRKRKYNEVYDLMDNAMDHQLEGTKRDLNNHFNEYGIEITSLSVTNVHLPREFAVNMQEESIWSTRDDFNKLEQKFALQKIAIKELEAKSKQKAQEDLANYTAEQDMLVAQQKKKLDLVNAETGKQIAQINEQAKADILDIKSKSLLVDAKINSERDVKLAKIRQSGSARSDQLKVESSTYVATKQAEAERIIAENKAQCMELNASAEAEAAKRMVSQRQYNKMMRSLQSMRGLAVNKDVCVSGKNGDNMVAQLLANVQSGAVLGLPSNLS